MTSVTAALRGRLPTCVVSMRSVLCCIAVSMRLRELGTHNLCTRHHGLQLAECDIARQIFDAAVRCDDQGGANDYRQGTGIRVATNSGDSTSAPDKSMTPSMIFLPRSSSR